jgi:hypothetical protein
MSLNWSGASINIGRIFRHRVEEKSSTLEHFHDRDIPPARIIEDTDSALSLHSYGYGAFKRHGVRSHRQPKTV